MTKEIYFLNNESRFIRKARELVYYPGFIIIRDYYQNRSITTCSIKINGEVNDEDAVQISLAPKNPSLTDLVIAKEAEKRLRRKNYGTYKNCV